MSNSDFADLVLLHTPEACSLQSELKPLADLAERLNKSRGNHYEGDPGDQTKGRE